MPVDEHAPLLTSVFVKPLNPLEHCAPPVAVSSPLNFDGLHI